MLPVLTRSKKAEVRQIWRLAVPSETHAMRGPGAARGAVVASCATLSRMDGPIRQISRGTRPIGGNPYHFDATRRLDIAGAVSRAYGTANAARYQRLARGWQQRSAVRDQAEREREEAIRRALAGESENE